MNEPIDLKKLTVAELWKLAFEQQEQVTNLVIQLEHTRNNIRAIKDEIASKETTTKVQKTKP